MLSSLGILICVIQLSVFAWVFAVEHNTYSLRTLLIATTITALVLGAIVYVTRQ